MHNRLRCPMCVSGHHTALVAMVKRRRRLPKTEFLPLSHRTSCSDGMHFVPTQDLIPASFIASPPRPTIFFFTNCGTFFWCPRHTSTHTFSFSLFCVRRRKTQKLSQHLVSFFLACLFDPRPGPTRRTPFVCLFVFDWRS